MAAAPACLLRLVFLVVSLVRGGLGLSVVVPISRLTSICGMPLGDFLANSQVQIRVPATRRAIAARRTVSTVGRSYRCGLPGNVFGYGDPMSSDESLSRELLDEFALRKLGHAYCRAVDRGDFATLRELYHHDAEDAHAPFSTGSLDDFLKTLADSHRHIRSMQHNVTTVNFAISGSTAEGEIYTIAAH